MRNHFVKLIITTWFTILSIKNVAWGVALNLLPREFNAKGWNYIYCQPRCRITTCQLICPIETADRWLDCMFALPYPGALDCIGVQIAKLCESGPCKNGGRCTENRLATGGSYFCTCVNGFIGSLCEIDPCNPNPCKNGAGCSKSVEGNEVRVQCSCPDGFIGSLCETSPCNPNPCKNGGTCSINRERTSFECKCANKFTGYDCSIEKIQKVKVSEPKISLESGFTNRLVTDLSEPMILCVLSCTNDVDCAVLNGHTEWVASGQSFVEKYVDQTDILFDQRDHLLYSSFKLRSLKAQNIESVKCKMFYDPSFDETLSISTSYLSIKEYFEFPFDQLFDTTVKYSVRIENDSRSDIGLVTKIRASYDCSTSCVKASHKNDIYWFVQGSNEYIHYENKQLGFDEIKNQVFTQLDEEKWSKYPNKNVFCLIYPIINEKRSAIPFKTEYFFIGFVLEIDNKKIELNDEKKDISVVLYETSFKKEKIKLYSTLPVLCLAPEYNCKLEFILGVIENTEDLFRVSNCENTSEISRDYCQSWINKWQMSQFAEWCLISTIDDRNLRISETNSQIKILLYQLNDVYGSNWLLYNLPTINLKYIPNPMTLSLNGYCINDPHCATFDALKFEFHERDGEYLLYENAELQFRTHLISEPCSITLQQPSYPNTAYCIKGVYVQSIDDFISFEMRRAPSLQYIDLSSSSKSPIGLVWNGIFYELNKENAIKIEQDADHFYITGHYGSKVMISKKGFLVSILPSKFDFNRTRGLFGNLNSNPNDEFGPANNQNEFFNRNKIRPENFLSEHKFYEFTFEKTVLENKLCKCSFEENFQCQSDNLFIDSSSFEKRKKRSTNGLKTKTFETDFFVYDYDPIYKNITNNNSVDKCNEVLSTNEQLRECDRLGIIKLTNFIQTCHMDYEATKSDIWPFIYLDELKSKCNFIVKNDKTFWKSGSEPNELLNKLCSSDCNKNGQCVSGVCKCNPGFTSFDCSIDLNKKPQLSDIISSNMCDLRKLSNCSKLILHGENFSDEMEIKLIVLDLFKSQNRIQDEIIYSQSVDYSSKNLMTINSNLILADLKQLIASKDQTSSFLLNVSVSYHKNIPLTSSEFSSEQTYLIYDSDCLQCKNVSFCDLKPSTCFIDDHCYPEGFQTVQMNNKLYCDPSKNKFQWAKFVLSQSNSLRHSYLIFFFLTFILLSSNYV